MRIESKRLAKANDLPYGAGFTENVYIDSDSDEPLPHNTNVSGTPDIFILPLSEKSFIVKGNILEHGSKLTELVGKYSSDKEGYIFANFRKPSVLHYISTGEVIPYKYTEEQKRQYIQTTHVSKSTPNSVSNTCSKERVWTMFQLKSIFQEIRDAFDADSYYKGESVIDVMNQIEEKYLPKPKTIKAVKQ